MIAKEKHTLERPLSDRPLADRLRPQALADVVGQAHLLGDDGFLRRTINSGRPASIIFWGPPGTGKTTLARLYANAFGAKFEQLSAVFSGVADIKKIVQEARNRLEASQKDMLETGSPRTVLFVDEIHRFNKSQQDAFLPYIEDGTIILVGATTENPSFSLNNALLSRVQVLTLEALDDAALEELIEKAEEFEGQKLPLEKEAREKLIHYAGGDGRYLLSMAEAVWSVTPEKDLTPKELEKLVQRRAALFDRAGEGHYNLISALHKSVRGSDPDASLYWFARMLEGGEDPMFIARRLIRMASEDIGLADPKALEQCLAAQKAYQTLGSPEGELALAQAVVYVALAPKSVGVYKAYKAARKSAKETNQLNPPKIILNAPTKLMKEQGYGEGYIYDHDTPQGFSGQNYFPDDMGRKKYYQPPVRGFERDMNERINYFNKLREKLNK